MKKKVFVFGLFIIFAVFSANIVSSMLDINLILNQLLGAENQGTESCDCDEEGGGVVGPGCNEFVVLDPPLYFVCCSSEGAFPGETCDCDIECNTPYNPEECVGAE